MEKPFLVRGTTSIDFPIVLGLGAIAFFALGLLLPPAAVPNAPHLFIPIAVGTMCLVPVVLRQLKRERVWLLVLPDGFRLIDYRGNRDYRDEQVVSTAHKSEDHFSDGVYKNTTRRFRVWVASDQPLPELLEMVYQVHKNAWDPAEKLVQRLSEKLYEAAKLDFASGKEILGEGWTLQTDRLVIRKGVEDFSIPLTTVSAVATIEGDVGIWQQGEERTAIRVPNVSANASLLLRLLSDYLREHPHKEADVETADGMGRLLFERFPGRSRLLLHIAGSLFLSFLGILAFREGLREGIEFMLIGIGMMGSALAWLFIACANATRRFRCHQNGIVYRGLLIGEKRLLYADVASISYNAAPEHIKHVYIGTAVELALEAVAEKQAHSFRYVDKVQDQDKSLEEMRERITNHIADRMEASFYAGQTVPWTVNLAFHQDCLEYQYDGFLRRKTMKIPYGTISHWASNHEFFYLWQHGQSKYVIRQYHRARNFYPGLCFLLRLLLRDELSSQKSL